MRGNAAWLVVKSGPPAITRLPWATQRSTMAATDAFWAIMALIMT